MDALFLLTLGCACLFLHSVLADKAKTCSPFPYAFLEHGRITAVGEQKYAFQCDPDYFLASETTVRCWKGEWSSTAEPKCLRSEGLCEDPSPIPGGDVHGKDRRVGSVVQYMCHPGFLLLGEGTRVCLESGYWSGIMPACMDESEPLQKLAERLKDKFVTEIGSHSSDSTVPQGRLLDRGSVKNGLELVMLMDRSSSVDPKDFEIGKEFIKFILKEFGVRNGNNTSGTRAAVLAFGTEVNIIFNVDNVTITGPQAANAALDAVQAGGGGTAMEAALTNIFVHVSPLLRENAKKAVFLITDGEPNIASPEITPQELADDLKDENFEIFTVGIGRGINRKLLSQLASEPLLSHLFILDKYSDLRKIMEIIKDSPPEAPPVSPKRCGFLKDRRKSQDTWPWMAAIYASLPYASGATRLSLCSGTLICSRWVLTAASCFFHIQRNESDEHHILMNIRIQEVFVVLGERHLVKEEFNQINFYAEDILIHPEFQPLDDLENNLALIKLNNPVPVGRFRPACLPPLDKTVPLHLDLNINTTIAGWGLPPTEESTRDVNGGTVRMHMSVTPVALAEEHECMRLSGKAAGENVFCAGFGPKTCIGDLGSPIMAVDPSTDLHHLLGVLSRRSKCYQGYNQYSELTQYFRWISDSTDSCHSEHWMA